MMDSLEHCDLMDLPKPWCAHCRGIKAPEEEAASEEKNYDRWLDKL